MKKEYTTPEIKITLFETESIMAASNPGLTLGGTDGDGALDDGDAIEFR